MKKRGKRLSLHRETVRNLADSRLEGVVGRGNFTLDPGTCGTTCFCNDDPGTFSVGCTTGCPSTSQGG